MLNLVHLKLFGQLANILTGDYFYIVIHTRINVMNLSHLLYPISIFYYYTYTVTRVIGMNM